MATLYKKRFFVCHCYVGLKWILHLLAFEERRKLEYPTSKLTHVWRRSGWRRVLSPPRYPCYPCYPCSALANQIDQEVPITQKLKRIHAAGAKRLSAEKYWTTCQTFSCYLTIPWMPYCNQ